jgi:hypothetical protein
VTVIKPGLQVEHLILGFTELELELGTSESEVRPAYGRAPSRHWRPSHRPAAGASATARVRLAGQPLPVYRDRPAGTVTASQALRPGPRPATVAGFVPAGRPVPPLHAHMIMPVPVPVMSLRAEPGPARPGCGCCCASGAWAASLASRVLRQLEWPRLAGGADSDRNGEDRLAAPCLPPPRTGKLESPGPFRMCQCQ